MNLKNCHPERSAKRVFPNVAVRRGVEVEAFGGRPEPAAEILSEAKEPYSAHALKGLPHCVRDFACRLLLPTAPREKRACRGPRLRSRQQKQLNFDSPSLPLGLAQDDRGKGR